MKIIKIISILSLIFIINSCLKTKKTVNLALTHAGDKGPELDIKDYLNGGLSGWGVIQDNKGNVIKRFNAKIEGEWDGQKGIVKRKFIFTDGKSDNRVWLITVNKNDFSAVGHEVVGTARGQQYKGLAQLHYDLEKSFDGVRSKTSVTETIYNIDGNSSISILDFKSAGSTAKKMILSLQKTKVFTAKKKKISKILNSSETELYF